MQLAARIAMLWLAVEAAHEPGEGMERLLLSLASVLRFTADLDRRLAGDGLGGLASISELHERVTNVLGALTPGVAMAQGTVAELVAALGRMEETLAALRRVKTELGHAP